MFVFFDLLIVDYIIIFFRFFYSSPAHELQQAHSSSGGLPPQSDTRTPRFPGGFVVLRFAQTSAGISPVRSVSLRNAIPVCYVEGKRYEHTIYWKSSCFIDIQEYLLTQVFQ